ncbi:hypothetical protein MMC07_007682 [Pseudocyphellaria aurata]|nr:hypothetical protein [Pseudocyphellaria aurata]
MQNLADVGLHPVDVYLSATPPQPKQPEQAGRQFFAPSAQQAHQYINPGRNDVPKHQWTKRDPLYSAVLATETQRWQEHARGPSNNHAD